MRKWLQILALSLVAGCAGRDGCGRNPLDSSPLPPVDGQIRVTVYQGTSPQANKEVFCQYPNGTKITALSGSPSGIATFEVQGEGTYVVGFNNQATTAPYTVSVPITREKTVNDVSLQLNGAVLSIQPAFGQTSTFPYDGTSFSYTVTYQNTSGLQQDVELTVDPASLPPGWLAQVFSPNLSKGSSTSFVLNTAQGTVTSTASVLLVGKVNSTTVLTQSITLTRGWDFKVRRAYILTNIPGSPNTFSLSGVSFTVQAINFPNSAIVGVQGTAISWAGGNTNPPSGEATWTSINTLVLANTLPPLYISTAASKNYTGFGSYPIPTLSSVFAFGSSSFTYVDVLSAAGTSGAGTYIVFN